MRKIINKVRKIFIVICGICIAIATKVHATVMIQPEYGIPSIPKKTAKDSIIEIFKNFMIPMALVIGIFVYFKKSKSGLRGKIVISLIIGIIGWIIWNLTDNIA